MNTKNWGWLLGGVVCVGGAMVIGMSTGVAQISLPQSVQSLTQTLKNTQIIRDDGVVFIELNKNGVIDILDGALRDKSIVLDDIDISTLSIGKKHECGADEAIVGIDNDKKVVCQGIEIGSLWSSHDKGKSSIYFGSGDNRSRVVVGSFPNNVDLGLAIGGDIQSDKAIILGKDEGLALVAPSSPAAIRHTKSLIVGDSSNDSFSQFYGVARVGFGKSVPEKQGLDIGGGLRVDGKSYIRHNGRNGAVTSWIAHVGDDKTIWSASRSGGSAKVGLVSPQVVVGGHMDSSGQIKTPGLRGDSLSVWGDMSAVSFSFHGYDRRTVGSLNPDNDIPEECVALSLDGNKQVVLVNVCDRPVNGVCAQSGISATKPTGKLCTAGKAPTDVTVAPDKKGWTWTCAGKYGGTDKICRVNVTWKVEQPTGTCGTGGVRTRKVTCVDGMICPQSKEPKNTTTDGCTASWTLAPTWSTCADEIRTKAYDCPTNRHCAGTKPSAKTQSCPTGVCGTADGKSYTSAPAASLRCSVGSVINFSGGTNGPRKWNCRGVNGGATSKQCEATKKVVNTITKCSDMQKVDVSKILNPSGHARLLSSVGEIQLTDDRTWQVGSAISKHKIDLKKDFTFSYDVYLGTKDSGADGLSFILHNDPRGAAAVGGAGHNMGAIGIKNGIFIEFDTHDNKRQTPGTADIPDDHTQIRRTSVPFSHADSKLSSIVSLGNIEDGRRHSVVFRRKASTKTFSYSVDGIAGPTLTDSDMYNKYFGGGSEVYFGFAGSTGDRSNRQKVRLKSFFESVQQVSGSGASDCQTRK